MKQLTLLLLLVSGTAIAKNQSIGKTNIRYFDQHWQEKNHHQHHKSRPYRCWNAWGQSMRGKYNPSESILIEHTEAECTAVRVNLLLLDQGADLSAINRKHCPLNKIYRAARHSRQ
jgi:hypothetical protein